MQRRPGRVDLEEAIDQRTGWHFPRAADGQYAGFHPADSDDAIARLDVQRQLGARYLVIPHTSAWWLDHYAQFFAHVRSCGRVLVEDPGTCWIFELSATVPALLPVETTAAVMPSTQQLIDLVDAVLPAAVTIVVLAGSDNELVTHSPRPTIALNYPDDSVIDVTDAIRELRQLAEGVADFLVVPASSREWLARQPTLAQHIEESHSLVTDQGNVCRIYDLKLGGEKVR